MNMFDDRKDRQFQAMLEPARERLKGLTPQEICSKAGVTYNESDQLFSLQSLGQTIKIHYPDFVIEQPLEMWHHLTLLQYLFTADGMELTGNWKGLQQMQGGISRGRGFDKDIETMFARYFSKSTGEEFRTACLNLGGELLEGGNADVTARFSYAPNFPILIRFWEADDEFPSSGKTLVDENAEHYLGIEAAGGACSAVVGELRKQVETNT